MNDATSFLESCIAHRVLITLSLPTRFLKLVIVECVEQCFILAAESLIGIANHLWRHECLTVCQVLVVLDDLCLDVLAMQASPSSPSGQGLGSIARRPCFAPWHSSLQRQSEQVRAALRIPQG